MSVKTPNYALTADFHYKYGPYDTKTLPAGTFVRPITTRYVPQHIIDKTEWRSFNEEKEVFCYTRFGMFAIPKAIIREV